MKVCVYRYNQPRSKRLADSLEQGVLKMGWKLEKTENQDHALSSDADIFASYGWVNRPIFERYRNSGRTFLYLDLGYWERKNGMGDYSGYHKVVVNARHANLYFLRERPSDRLDDAPRIEDWRNNDNGHIVVAGLSAKSARASGYQPLEWERETISEIRKFTDREIVYRPKPSWVDARPIAGTTYSGNNQKIVDALKGSSGLVTLHSNAAIDALAYGVPIYAAEGLAAAVSCASIEELINNPRCDVDRSIFLRQVSYCQWRRYELEDGTMFRQMVRDGMIKP